MKSLILAIHNHQPVGNFHRVIEHAFDVAYRPLFELIGRHPKVRVVLHISGSLLDWLERHRPDYIGLIGGLVERGQIELLGGGYYEPLLPLIPARDMAAQLELMGKRLKCLFGITPRGIWVTERAWDTGIVGVLRQQGIDYVVLDDNHLIKAGIETELPQGYYITHDRGVPIKVFGGSQRLRYLIPFEDVGETERYIRQADSQLFVFADDGEKFGLWPTTYRVVHQEGWLDRFLSWLESAVEWLATTTFSEYIEGHPPAGMLYVPPLSYREMEQWALPPKLTSLYRRAEAELLKTEGTEGLRFLQGGYWQNLLYRYPEARWLYSRMMRLSERLSSAVDVPGHASIHLYRAQCNDAYWHGVFGGLYLAHLRGAIYGEIIRAERLLDGEGDSPEPLVEEDGECQQHTTGVVRLNGGGMSLFWLRHRGMAMVEWDLREEAINLCNVVARWKEAYHQEMEGLKDSPQGDEGARSIHHRIRLKGTVPSTQMGCFDRAQRLSFVETLLKEGLTMEDYHRGVSPAVVGSPYFRCLAIEPRQGGFVAELGAPQGIRLLKGVSLGDGRGFELSYRLAGGSKWVDATGRLAVELNLRMPSAQDALLIAGDRRAGVSGSLGFEGLYGFSLYDAGAGLSVDFSLSHSAGLWMSPLYTLSLTEDGIESTYQGTTLVVLVPSAVAALPEGFVMSISINNTSKDKEM